MINSKSCSGCRDNYYNSPATSGDSTGMCWNRKSGKMVWRISVGTWEQPPYKDKKKVRVPNCWHGQGIIMVDSKVLTCDGYWKC